MLFQLCFFKFSSMCYSFYKIGKNKRLSGGPQGQVDNQYCDRQTNEMTSNATFHSQSKYAVTHVGSGTPIFGDYWVNTSITCVMTYSTAYVGCQ